jgi:hypothetical protein
MKHYNRMAELLFGFTDLLNVSKPNVPILDLSSFILTDGFVRKFNPKRYNFYVKFVNGLSNPSNLYKFLYTMKDSKVYHDDLQSKLITISKALNKLSPENKKSVIEKLKVVLNANVSDNKYNPLYSVIQDIGAIKKTGGDGYYIKKNKMPMSSFLTDINAAIPELGVVPKNDISDIIIKDGTEDTQQGADTHGTSPEALSNIKGILKRYEDLPQISPERVNINMIDRAIFIITTLILRLITLSLIFWCMNANLINSFKTAFIYYCIIYILFFIFLIAIVNVIYYYPIIELFSNISLVSMPNLLYYFYIHINGPNRLILHILIILILSFIPFILSMDQKIKDQSNLNISFDYKKKTEIYNSISNFSLVIWLLTSVVAIKF